MDAIEREMLADIRAYRVRQLRERAAMTQVQLTGAPEVSQDRISRIEHGAIDRVQVDTLRRYVEAFGGTRHIEVVLEGDWGTLARPPSA